jgi:hypothetical protein
VRGQAGIGKTALLGYAIESASDLRIMRAVGVESGMELAFAGLHQLCVPMLGRLDRLPDPQRDALQTAFGLSPGAVPGAGLIEAALREVALRGEGQGVAVAQSAGAILYNGLGRSREALAAARIASECRGELVFRNWGLAELVEAAVRCGDGAAATDALESPSQTTRPSDTDWALGGRGTLPRAAQPRRNRRASVPRGNRTVGSQPRSRTAPSESCRPLAGVSANAS